MPKEVLLKEIDRIISQQQSKFGGVFKQKKIGRQTMKQWTRGLACWDLISEEGFNQYKLAKELAPLWREGDSPALESEPPLDEDKKQVRTALNSVSPMISGGWKILCGDPVATLNSGHLELDMKCL